MVDIRLLTVWAPPDIVQLHIGGQWRGGHLGKSMPSLANLFCDWLRGGTLSLRKVRGGPCLCPEASHHVLFVILPMTRNVFLWQTVAASTLGIITRWCCCSSSPRQSPLEMTPPAQSPERGCPTDSRSQMRFVCSSPPLVLHATYFCKNSKAFPFAKIKRAKPASKIC